MTSAWCWSTVEEWATKDTSFAASCMAVNFLKARSSARRAWFRFQKDANLYFDLPAPILSQAWR